MSDDVIKFPVERVYPNVIGGNEIWAQADPPDMMVWAVCPWVRSREEDSRCLRCPSWESDPIYGAMRRGCYGMAAEVCRIVFAMQARAAKTTP